MPIPTQPKPKIAHISQKKKKQDEEQFVFMKCVVPSQRNPLEHTFANQINILTQHMVDFPYWKLHNSTIPQRDEEQFLVNRLVSLEKNPMEHLLIIFMNKDLI